MNLFNDFRAAIVAAVERLQAAGELPADLPMRALAVEPPRDPTHGDLSTNAAMVLGKPARMAPKALADKLKPALEALPGVTGVEIAGPGFINLRLTDAFWQTRLADILKAGAAYGDSAIGGGEAVNVEYVSANPTGPMHVGHCRGAVFGDALSGLLEKAGFAVTREYYINDAGSQVDVLARSAHLRYREALGETVTIPEGLYPGDYLKPVGAAIARAEGERWRSAPEGEWLPQFRRLAIDAMMGLIREDLAALGIRHKVFASEKALHEGGAVKAAVDDLANRGLVYTGVLEPPKGKLPDDWEPRPQLLFRASQFGDDIDRPLQKSDGAWTYFAADIAYHWDKYRRGFRHLINVLGADHGGYVKRLQAAVKAVSNGEASLDVKIIQLVNLMDGGEPVKMSKRSGTFVTLRDVVDEVGKDVVRFIMLTRKNDAALDFDYQKVREQSKDNPVFYVQYAHARVHSVLRRAGMAAGDNPPVAMLSHPAEIALVRTLANWPRIVEQAALAHEPHRIAFYLYDLAAEFHALWNRGNDEPGLRFVQDGQPDLTRARLAMITGVAAVIASGLKVLGVTPVEEMR
jgi:arginyl-tRNA synthetase